MNNTLVRVMLLATVALIVSLACTKEVIKEVPVERIVTQEVVKEVPVEKIVEVTKEVVKTVEIEKPVEVIKEVVKEVIVPGDTIVVEKEVVKTVEVEKEVVVTKEVEVEVEKIVEVEAAKQETASVALGAMPVHVVGGMIPSLQSRIVSTELYRSVGLLNESTGQADADLGSFKLISDNVVELSFEPGQYFHNGEEITAEGLKRQVDYLLSAKPLRYAWSYGGIGYEIELLDKYTAELTREKPSAFWANPFNTMMLLAPDHLEKGGVDGYADGAVGTADFKFIDWERDSHINLERWEDDPRGLSVLKSMTFRHVPEAAVRTAGLQAGDFDVSALLPPENITQLIKKGFRIFAGDSMQSHSWWLDYQGLTEELSDVKVRQAMLYAIDKDKIYGNIVGGYGTKLECQIGTSAAFGHNPDLKSYPYDPEKAKALLTEAGYPNGFSIKGSSSQARYFRDAEIAPAIQAYWKDIGIDMDLKYYESAAWLDALIANVLPPIMNIGLNWFNSTNAPSMRSGGLDPKFDELRAAVPITLDDDARRKAVQDQVAYACDQAYGWFAHTVPALYGLNPDLPDISWGLGFEMHVPMEK